MVSAHFLPHRGNKDQLHQVESSTSNRLNNTCDKLQIKLIGVPQPLKRRSVRHSSDKQCATKLVYACKTITNEHKTPYLNFSEDLDDDQTLALERGFETAENNPNEKFLSISDNLFHFPPLYLDSCNFLKFKKKVVEQFNCGRVFLGAEQLGYLALEKQWET